MEMCKWFCQGTPEIQNGNHGSSRVILSEAVDWCFTQKIHGTVTESDPYPKVRKMSVTF